MAKRRKMQEVEYEEERENATVQRTPITIEDLIRKDRTRLAVSAVFEVILVLMELYVMFNMGDELLIIGIGIVPIAALLYLIISSAVDIDQLSKQQDAEKYDEIYRAQKASYLVIKRNFEDLQQRMDDMEDVAVLPTDQIIGAQKAVAKVTISRSKENADALMTSNEMLIEKLFKMEELLENNNKELMSHQSDMLNGTKTEILQKNQEVLQKNQELLQKNQELLQKNQELEGHISNLKATIAGIESKVNSLETKATQPSVIINQAPAGAMTDGNAGAVTPPIYAQPQMNMAPQESMPMPEESSFQMSEESSDELALEPSLDMEIDEMQESIAVEEPVYETPNEENIEDLASIAEAANNEEYGEEIEISALDPELEAALNQLEENMPTEELSLDEMLPTEELTLEDAIPEEELSLEDAIPEDALSFEEDMPLEEIPVEEAPVEEAPVMEEAPVEEAPVEEAPVEEVPVEETPVEEAPAEDESANVADALAGLDTSDPNKVMSPDEIQALFAKL